jgi:hypothetical protein
MQYNQFIKSITRPNVAETIRSYGNTLEKLEDGTVAINSLKTEFKNLEEARKYIKSKITSENIAQEVTDEIYESLSENKIAEIIKEYYDIKVTDTLIESYIELASSNLFNVDPVVYEIRKLNKVDTIIENKIHYKLSDNSVVAINEATQIRLNNLLSNQKEIVEYMRESKENFLHVLEQLEE